MRVLFTDGTLDSIQAIYLLFGSEDESLRPQIIIVDEGIIDLEQGLQNIMSLVATMQIVVPIYYGSRRRISKSWDDNFKWYPDADKIFERKRQYMYKLQYGNPNLASEPVEAIVLGPLTTAAEWVKHGKISHITFVAGGKLENEQDKAIIGKYMKYEPNMVLDPEAYNYILNSGIPQKQYSLQDISNEEMLKARMMGMSNKFLRSTIPPQLISEWRYWSMIVIMHYLGYFK